MRPVKHRAHRPLVLTPCDDVVERFRRAEAYVTDTRLRGTRRNTMHTPDFRHLLVQDLTLYLMQQGHSKEVAKVEADDLMKFIDKTVEDL